VQEADLDMYPGAQSGLQYCPEGRRPLKEAQSPRLVAFGGSVGGMTHGGGTHCCGDGMPSSHVVDGLSRE
jgi:hypothetical protein